MTGPAEHPASGGGLAELIAERARETPDAPALRCGEAVLGYRELDEAARRHVLRRWRFQPAMRDGRAVQAIGLVPIEFSLDRG